MKKSKRIFCMLLAAVMLLGSVPVYAAAPLSPLTALLAIPVSGQLMNAGTVSDSISKPSESIPAPAPEPTPASISDGTTGATVGTAGVTSANHIDMFVLNSLYHRGNRVNLSAFKAHKGKVLVEPSQGNHAKTFVCYIDITKCTPADLVGVTIPADLTVDVFTYDPNTDIYTFLCQYDTHGTGALTITQAPYVWASKQPQEAPAPARTSFNDVNPGDWYYEAVTALAQGGVLHTVFDTDPNGNFNPNALIKDSEVDFIQRRLRGLETEGLVMDTTNDNVNPKTGEQHWDWTNVISSRTTRAWILSDIVFRYDLLAVKPAAPTQLDTRQTDNDAMAKFVEYYVSTKTEGREGCFMSDDQCRALIQEQLRKAIELNLIRTPGTPETIDFDARLTRAEYCVLLCRAGLTSFGCIATN